jgi:hypothetical protein
MRKAMYRASTSLYNEQTRVLWEAIVFQYYSIRPVVSKFCLYDELVILLIECVGLLSKPGSLEFLAGSKSKALKGGTLDEPSIRINSE